MTLFIKGQCQEYPYKTSGLERSGLKRYGDERSGNGRSGVQ
jgi:hypothetical protein